MADPITWPKPNIPVKRKTFAQPEVLTALQKSELRKLNPIFTDSQYVACTRAEWQAVLTEANTKALEYVPEVHDCDDFGGARAGPGTGDFGRQRDRVGARPELPAQRTTPCWSSRTTAP